MHKTLRKVLAVLDGTPIGMRGQSMVEFSITAPIFIIMLVGLAEVGWFANNYLVLSDVVRSAGRFGSLHDPIKEWTEGEEKNYHRLDCDAILGSWDGSTTFNLLPPSASQGFVTTPPSMGAAFFVGQESSDLGYFDGVACSAIFNMTPLVLNEDEDDIVVSVFSYATVKNCGSGPCVRIAGRYPSGANECAGDTFDPFDVDRDGVKDDFENDRFDAATNEGYRGYVLRANQIPKDDGACRGSDFTSQRVEDMLNKTMLKTDSTLSSTALEVGFLPNSGLVLVEIQWESYQLLGLPFFSWVGNPIEIRIWGMFPVPAAEPELDCWTNATCVSTD